MKAQAGARIVAESKKAAQAGRTGVIEEVLNESPQRLRVRWDDGTTSIFVPSAGSVKIEEPAAQSAR